MQSELSNHLDFGSLTGICAIDDGGHNILVITLIAIAPGILLIPPSLLEGASCLLSLRVQTESLVPVRLFLPSQDAFERKPLFLDPR